MTCGVSCNLLQNAFGRWVSGFWRPYVHGKILPLISTSLERYKMSLQASSKLDAFQTVIDTDENPVNREMR